MLLTLVIRLPRLDDHAREGSPLGVSVRPSAYMYLPFLSDAIDSQSGGYGRNGA